MLVSLSEVAWCSDGDGSLRVEGDVIVGCALPKLRLGGDFVG